MSPGSHSFTFSSGISLLCTSHFSPPHRSCSCLNFSTGFFSRPARILPVVIFFPTLPSPPPPPLPRNFTAAVDEGQAVHIQPRASLEILGPRPPSTLFATDATASPALCLGKPSSNCVEHVGSSPQLDGSMAGFASCSWPIWHVDDFTLCFQRESVPLRHAPSPPCLCLTCATRAPAAFCPSANTARPATSRSSCLPLWCRCLFSTCSHKI